MVAWSAGYGKNRRQEGGNGRLKLLAAVVFLLTGILLSRLAYLAVWRYDYYLAAAANQHDLVSRISPVRGKIYLRDMKDEGELLYPLAANQELINVYAVPNEVKDPAAIAHSLYETFRRPLVEQEVDQWIKDQEAAGWPEVSSTTTSTVDRSWLLNNETYALVKNAKRQAMIESKRSEIMEKYMAALNKKNDPYEPLEKRVDPELVKNFHLAASGSWPLPLQASDLQWSGTRLVADKLDYSLGDPLALSGIGYEKDVYRNYPEKNVAAHLLGYVSLESESRNGDWGRHGRYGLEGFFDQELFGSFGEVKAQRGSGGLTIANEREFKDATGGDDLILTIDRTIQFFIAEKIKAAVERYQADSGSVIVLEPYSGAVIAMNSYPDFDPNEYGKIEDVKFFNNPAIFDQYEPGSVFKAVTMAAAVNEGKVNQNTTYDDPGQLMIKGWPKPIKNSDFETAGGHGTVNMTQVLEKSLNTGSIFAMRSIGDQRFAEYVAAFGFGEKTGIELEGEAPGNISSLQSKKIKEISAATASFGQGITVTPIQMAAAYATIVNGGMAVKPYIVSEIRHADGQILKTEPAAKQAVLTPETSKIISSMLVSVVENGHANGAKLDGYWIGGKTGTAQMADSKKRGYVENAYNHTFLSFGPAQKPLFVMLVRLQNPKGYVYADSTTVPTAREIIEFMMKYWQVPKNR